jgi:predicted DNA-binding protein (MmcQ/YjbR family)
MNNKPRPANDALLGKLRAFGLGYPGAHRKSPWPGHDDLAVNDKTFAYLSAEGEPFSISFKLPYTSHEALKLPFAKPTGYGLGRSGWVTLEPGAGEMPPIEMLESWIDESYRAQRRENLPRRSAETLRQRPGSSARRSRGELFHKS